MSILDSLQSFWDQQVHPVYNNLGRPIGWYASAHDLAAGKITPYAGETVPDPATWRVKNALGILVNADKWLLTSAGLQPSWEQAGGIMSQAATGKTPDIGDGIVLPSVNLDFGDLAQNLNPFATPAGRVSTTSMLVLGGVAVLAGLMVAKRL